MSSAEYSSIDCVERLPSITYKHLTVITTQQMDESSIEKIISLELLGGCERNGDVDGLKNALVL